MAPSESEEERASERASEREREKTLRYSFDDIDPVVFAKTFVTDCVRFLVTRRARRRPMRLHVTKDTGADTRNRTLAPNRGRRYIYIAASLPRDKRVISDYPQHLNSLFTARAKLLADSYPVDCFLVATRACQRRGVNYDFESDSPGSL